MNENLLFFLTKLTLFMINTPLHFEDSFTTQKYTDYFLCFAS